MQEQEEKAGNIEQAAAPELEPETGEMPNPLVFVIGHVRMLAMAARGEWKPKNKELIEQREKAILAYLRTGQLLPTDGDAEMLEILKQVFSDAMLKAA